MNLDEIPFRKSIIAASIIYLCKDLVFLYLKYHDWDKVKMQALDDNLAQKETISSRKRYTQEALARAKTLTKEELSAFYSLSSDEQLMLMWVAFCRHNALGAFFAVRVLHTPAVELGQAVTNSDYDRFYADLRDEYSKFQNVSEIIYKKLRGNIFATLITAGLMDRQHRVIRKYRSSSFNSLFLNHDPDELQLLPKAV